MGEWYELDFTPEEAARVKVAADHNGVPPEEWISRIIRSSVAMSERLGARLPDPKDALDIRKERR